MIRAVPALATFLLLAACGARGELRPAEGAALPPAPYGARTPPRPAELTAPETAQRPSRSDELLTDSNARPDDPFELPPTG